MSYFQNSTLPDFQHPRPEPLRKREAVIPDLPLINEAQCPHEELHFSTRWIKMLEP